MIVTRETLDDGGAVAALGRLRATRLRFAARAIDAIEWGGFPGSALRGGFLAGLLDVGCVVPARDCPRCDLRHDCPVTRISGEHEDPSPTRTALYRVAPPREKSRIEPDEEFVFGVDLYGDAAESRTLALAAVERFAERGVGRRRARFSLSGIAPDATRNPARLHDELAAAVRSLAATAESGLELRFETPLRIVSGGRSLSSFSVDPFVRSLVRRARLLLESAEGCALEVDHHDLLARTASVRVVATRLSKRDQVRFSSRQRRLMNLHGIEGAVVLDGDLSPFLPWLAFGAIVGAGKGATFGHGAYSCVPVGAIPSGVERR